MVLLILLVISAYFDYRQRRIPVFCIGIGLSYWGVRTVYQFFVRETLTIEPILGDIVCGLILVSICIVMRAIWKESIGIGDILLLGMMTLVGGRKTIMGSLIFVFLFLFGVSVILLATRHSKKTTIPFAPFLLMGYLVWLLVLYL